MDYSPPGSSVRGIFQARVLEWVAISFSRGSSQTRDRTQVSCIVGRCFYHLSPQMQIKITMRYSLTPGRMAVIKRQTVKQPLVKMWENWILNLLVGMYNGLATLENSLAVP